MTEENPERVDMNARLRRGSTAELTEVWARRLFGEEAQTTTETDDTETKGDADA